MVEQMFSIMSIVKTKLRNQLVHSSTCHGRGGESCNTFKPLPAMLARINASMYDYKGQRSAIASSHKKNELRKDIGDRDQEMIEI